MTSVVLQVRCTDTDKELWRAAAARLGVGLSEWVRRAASEQVALEVALEREALTERGKQPERVFGAAPSGSIAVPRSVSVPAIPGVTVAARLPANFCKRTGLERSGCLCPDCKGA